MTTFRGLWTATAAATLFLISACAQPAAESVAGAAGTSSAPPQGKISADGLVLRVAYSGGFVTPDMRAGRLPKVSVYADGRVITEGPTTMEFPGPALPNLQVVSISPEQAVALANKATAAGVTTGTDFGTPGVADAPATEVTAVTASGAQTVAAEALGEARADDPALTDAQKQARAKLRTFLDEVDKLTADPAIKPVGYKPEILAAVAGPYVVTDDTVRPQTTEWPGPVLPGEPLAEGLDLTCVTVTGEQLAPVLAAAEKAKSNTSWTYGGNAWSLRFRPLLPDETGCADLKATR